MSNTLVVDIGNSRMKWAVVGPRGTPLQRAAEPLRIMERWTLVEQGNVLEIELRMTDPQHWEGEWVNTKRYNIRDDRDISEVHCIPAEMSRLPSAQPSSNTR